MKSEKEGQWEEKKNGRNRSPRAPPKSRREHESVRRRAAAGEVLKKCGKVAGVERKQIKGVDPIKFFVPTITRGTS